MNKTPINSDHFLKCHWLLKDQSIIEVFRLSAYEAEQLAYDHEQKIKPDTTRLPDHVLLSDLPEYVLLEKDDLDKLSQHGRAASTVFFAYTPDGQEFINNRQNRIKNSTLIQSLSLTFDESGLQMLEKYFYEQKPSRIEVKKHFLDILAFCGEIMCQTLNGDWFLMYQTPGNPSWYPVIKAEDRYYDVFADFHESLLEYDKGDFPTIILQSTNQIEPPNGNFLNRAFLSGDFQELDFKEINASQITALKQRITDWAYISSFPTNDQFDLYLLNGQQILLIEKNQQSGLLFNSNEDYQIFYQKTK